MGLLHLSFPKFFRPVSQIPEGPIGWRGSAQQTVYVTRVRCSVSLGLISRPHAHRWETVERLRTLGSCLSQGQSANPTASKNERAPKSSKLISARCRAEVPW